MLHNVFVYTTIGYGRDSSVCAKIIDRIEEGYHYQKLKFGGWC